MCKLGGCKPVMVLPVFGWLLVPVVLLSAAESQKSHPVELRSPRPQRNLGPCFPSPCFHHGECNEADGLPVCTCKPGFTGPFCKEMVVKLQCEEEYMNMMVRKEVFDALKIPLASVHLKSRACKVSEQQADGASFWGAKLTGENHTACGSVIKVNSSHVSYANAIESDREHQGVITRSVLLRVHFSCIYAYKQVVGLLHPVKAVDTIVQFAVKEGDFSVTMVLYESASYEQPFLQQPVALFMTDTLYVLLQLEGQEQAKYFFLSVEDCWGTPTADPNHSIKHPLILKGCPHDKTLAFLSDIGTSTEAKFSFQMFQFENFTEVFLHCQVRLCIPDTLEPCAKQCPSKQRNKRAMADDYRKIVSYGPIQFLVPSPLETQNAKQTESPWRLQIWIPGAVVSAAVAAAIVLVAVAKALKK
ncbi:uromodulin-like [Varanus komodoensis]|uniref:uromodulin-like n=1 Tax=Varanus komodoensis TaxID=61221 RepID=UPI001CF78284|nr:uromodulin-like [Varanus komodoensis]